MKKPKKKIFSSLKGLFGIGNQKLYGPPPIDERIQGVYGPPPAREESEKIYGPPVIDEEPQDVYGPPPFEEDPIEESEEAEDED